MLAIIGYALTVMLISVYICTRIDAARARRVSLSKVRISTPSGLESTSDDAGIARAFARIA